MAEYVLEADGGSRGNPGPAAFGTVLREARTHVVVAELGEYIGHATNNVAEYRGLIAGLEYLAERDPSARVEARLDSKLVVEQMSGNWKIKNSMLQKLALRAGDALPRTSVRFIWVPRHQNAAADAIVNECLDLAAAGDPARIWREA